MRTKLVVLAMLCASACSQPLGAAPAPEAPPTPSVQNPYVEGALPTGFFEATTFAAVPGELLVAIAQTETAMQMIVGEVEFDGQEPAFGVMGIRESHIARASELSGYTPDEIRFDRVANVVATAMLLDEWAQEQGIDPTRLDAWAPVVAEYSGIADEEALAEYVHYEVFDVLETGLVLEGVEFKPQQLSPDYPTPTRSRDNRARESSAIWSPSPNTSSRGGVNPSYIIIHTCEGSYSGCWGWLTNSSSGVSAHYVVNNTGSEVRALVDEDRKAWHISANYACSRNGNQDCSRNGAAMNTHSVGIEHAGYGSQTSWNAGLIQRSAELTCHIAQRNNIPLDRYHVYGHGQMQPWNRSDPGANWPWASYMSKAQEACGSSVPTPAPTPAPTPVPDTPTGPAPTPTGVPIIIDSNNGANNTNNHYIQVSSSWFSSASVSGHWNTGYWAAPTESVADAAEFRFNVSASSQCYRVEAYWPAAGDRPSAITFLGLDPNEAEVGRTVVNQRLNGGRWNQLGHWTFPQGWNKVVLSRWASSGSFAVADAVRITPSTGCN